MDISTTAKVGARLRAPVGVDVSVPPLTFQEFYAAHVDDVIRALTLVLEDSELATDATSEAMIRAYQRWSKISQYKNPAGWVYRVGLNWSVSWKRRRRREADRPIRFTREFSEMQHRDDSLDAAFAALSIDHRSIIVCRVHLDWSVDQTAEALGLAPGTVKSRLARALANLRTLIETNGEPEPGGMA